MTAVGSKGRTRGGTSLDAVGVLAGAWWVQTSNILVSVYSPFSSKLRKRGSTAGYHGIGMALRGAAALQAEPAPPYSLPEHTLLPAVPRPSDLPLPMSQLRGDHTASPAAPLVSKTHQKCQNAPPPNDSQLHDSDPQAAVERLSPFLPPFLLARLTPILFPCSRRVFAGHSFVGAQQGGTAGLWEAGGFARTCLGHLPPAPSRLPGLSLLAFSSSS